MSWKPREGGVAKWWVGWEGEGRKGGGGGVRREAQANQKRAKGGHGFVPSGGAPGAIGEMSGPHIVADVDVDVVGFGQDRCQVIVVIGGGSHCLSGDFHRSFNDSNNRVI